MDSPSLPPAPDPTGQSDSGQSGAESCAPAPLPRRERQTRWRSATPAPTIFCFYHKNCASPRDRSTCAV